MGGLSYAWHLVILWIIFTSYPDYCRDGSDMPGYKNKIKKKMRDIVINADFE